MFSMPSKNFSEVPLQLGDQPKIARGKVWTVGKLRDGLVAILCQLVGYQDGILDWRIVTVKLPSVRNEELLRRNHFPNSHATSTKYSLLTVWPEGPQWM